MKQTERRHISYNIYYMLLYYISYIIEKKNKKKRLVIIRYTENIILIVRYKYVTTKYLNHDNLPKTINCNTLA